MQTYKNNTEHILAELAWLDLLIRHEVEHFRSEADGPQGALRGLYISDADVDRLLHSGTEEEKQSDDEFFRQAADLSHEVERCKDATLAEGTVLTLPHLARLFGLDRFEQHLVLLALAPEIDPKYERLFGYLHDDISRRRATTGLALRLLCRTQEQRMNALSPFSPQATLFRTGLLKHSGAQEETLVRRPLALDEAAVNFLLGITAPPEDLQACLHYLSPAHQLEELRCPPETKAQLLRVLQQSVAAGAEQAKRLIVHLFGPRGSGKRTLAAALCHKLGFPLLVVDVAELLRRFAEPENAIQRIFRYALLLQCPVYFDQIELLTAEDAKGRSHLHAFRRHAGGLAWLMFLGTESLWSPDDGFEHHTFISAEVPAPDATTRQELWQEMAVGIQTAPDVDWDDLAVKFRLTPGRMEKALAMAAARANLREGPDAVISRADLYQGCYSQSNQKLATLAQRIVPRHRWSDIILPANALDQLHEICTQLKYRRQVYELWGFNEKLSRGKGLCALFYGQSGVGKTMAAEVLAHELFLEIYKIDLSTVVSKYIGETEKNLSKIFREAEDSNAILFFDEADALFGKRSEVKDAHDRYANIEINYLLQRMEEFDGLVVLATNLRRNIDEGFFRRMHFAVEFPFPDQAGRYRIWKQHFPAQLPVAGDVDLDYMARRFPLSGGNIKNVVLAAAFQAAKNSGEIHMAHLIRATRREYEKIGRLCTENEFAPYQWALLGNSPEQPVEAGPA